MCVEGAGAEPDESKRSGGTADAGNAPHVIPRAGESDRRKGLLQGAEVISDSDNRAAVLAGCDTDYEDVGGDVGGGFGG